MRKELILLIFIALVSCSHKEYKFDLNGKWVLLTTEYKGTEIRNEIIFDPLLSYTIRDKKFYPAIRFNRSDSTVIVPGNDMKKEKLNFSVDKNFKNIQFFKEEKTNGLSLIDKLFTDNFKVQKDKKLGELILRSDNVIIRMMPAERFANRIKSSQLD